MCMAYIGWILYTTDSVHGWDIVFVFPALANLTREVENPNTQFLYAKLCECLIRIALKYH